MSLDGGSCHSVSDAHDGTSLSSYMVDVPENRRLARVSSLITDILENIRMKNSGGSLKLRVSSYFPISVQVSVPRLSEHQLALA
jgi:hypothetical protein